MVFASKTLSFFRRMVGRSADTRVRPRSRNQPAGFHCTAEVLEDRALLSAVAIELVQDVLGGQLNGRSETPAVVNEQLTNAVQQLAAGLDSLSNSNQAAAASQQFGSSLAETLTANNIPDVQAALTQAVNNIQQSVAGGIRMAVGQNTAAAPIAQLQQSLLDVESQLRSHFDAAANVLSTKLDFVSDVLKSLGGETDDSGMGSGLADLVSSRIESALGSLSDLPSLQNQLAMVADRIETEIGPAIESALPSEALNSVSALLDDLGDSLADWPQPRDILQAELDGLFGRSDELDEILAAIA